MEAAPESETAAGTESETGVNEVDMAGSESVAKPQGGEEGTAAVAESRHDASMAEDKHVVDSDAHGDKTLDKESSHQVSGELNQVEAPPAVFPEGDSQQQPAGGAESASGSALEHKDVLAEQQAADVMQPHLEPLPEKAYPAGSEVPEVAATNGADQQDAAAPLQPAALDSSSDQQTAEHVQHASVHSLNTAANSSHAKHGNHATSSKAHAPQHNSTDQHISHPPSQSGSPHTMKETAIERLTTPTAMRMLKHLEQTQGGKQEWHIATGVPFKSKQLSADELSAMVDRLCSPKHETDNMPPKPHAVKLAYEGSKEVLVPVKESSKEENIAYMANLYDRCQETRAKTLQTLQDKWLKPLGHPLRHTASSK